MTVEVALFQGFLNISSDRPEKHVDFLQGHQFSTFTYLVFMDESLNRDMGPVPSSKNSIKWYFLLHFLLIYFNI